MPVVFSRESSYYASCADVFCKSALHLRDAELQKSNADLSRALEKEVMLKVVCRSPRSWTLHTDSLCGF